MQEHDDILAGLESNDILSAEATIETENTLSFK
jgi:hypothetical protein